MRTIQQTIDALPPPSPVPLLPAPPYTGPRDDARTCVLLAVDSMRTHTSSEGPEFHAALEHAGYVLHGHNIGPSLTDVRKILSRESPGILVLQDKREWMGLTAGRTRDPAMQFRNVEALRERTDVLKLALVKDAHADAALHRQSAEEAGVHAWISYYSPKIVCHLLPFLRPSHVIRTWHTVDASLVPPYYASEGRQGCLLSGAISAAYPLRSMLVQRRAELPHVTYLAHPGYAGVGNQTPAFLRTLSQFRVSIATSSRYGYSLRRIVESTACGCRVITDLPVDEVMPGGIDGNLVRVPHDSTPRQVGDVIDRLCADYDPERQREYARRACEWYDYKASGLRLATAIEAMRRAYP